MRMEIGFKFLGSDMRRDDTAVMAGLHKFIKLRNKEGEREFVGREVCAEELKNGTSRYMVKMEIDIDDADAYGDNLIFCGDKLVGWTTSGAYSHQSDKSLAFGYLYDGYHNDKELELCVEIVGQRRPIRVITESLLK